MSFYLKCEVDDDELRSIFDRLEEAMEVIYDCYSELKKLDALTIKREDVSGN